jgi:hypothetical protein
VQREGKFLGDGKVLGVREVNGRGLGLRDAAIEESYRGSGGLYGDGEAEGTAIPQGDVSGEMVAGMNVRSLGGPGKGEGETLVVLAGPGLSWNGSRISYGSKLQVVQGELANLIEVGPGERGGGIAGVEGKGVEPGGLGEGLCSDGRGLGASILVDVEVDVAGVDGFQREGDVDDVRLIGVLPLGVCLTAGSSLEGDGVDAGGAGGAEGEVVIATGDQNRIGGELPVGSGYVLEGKCGTGERVESPEAGDGAGDGGFGGSGIGGLLRA